VLVRLERVDLDDFVPDTVGLTYLIVLVACNDPGGQRGIQDIAGRRIGRSPPPIDMC